jgi:hypothetical protein
LDLLSPPGKATTLSKYFPRASPKLLCLSGGYRWFATDMMLRDKSSVFVVERGSNLFERAMLFTNQSYHDDQYL